MNLKNGKVFTSKSVGTGPSSYEKRIYWAEVSHRLRNTALGYSRIHVFPSSVYLMTCPRLNCIAWAENIVLKKEM